MHSSRAQEKVASLPHVQQRCWVIELHKNRRHTPTPRSNASLAPCIHNYSDRAEHRAPSAPRGRQGIDYTTPAGQRAVLHRTADRRAPNMAPRCLHCNNYITHGMAARGWLCCARPARCPWRAALARRHTRAPARQNRSKSYGNPDKGLYLQGMSPSHSSDKHTPGVRLLQGLATRKRVSCSWLSDTHYSRLEPFTPRRASAATACGALALSAAAPA